MYRVLRYARCTGASEGCAMTAWKIAEPERLTLEEDVTDLSVSLVSGRLNVVGGDGPARIEVTHIGEHPLDVTLDGGRLTIAHEFPKGWPGFLWWLLGGRYKVDVNVVVPVDA